MHSLGRLIATVAVTTALAAVSALPLSATATVDRAPAVTAPMSFTDVVPGMPFHGEITWLADQGVSTGWADGTFRPYQPVTRDAMAAFMYRLAGSPDISLPAVSPFVDVPMDYQFYKEIAWLDSAGISTGWSGAAGREFRPWNLITRDAMAAFLYRYKGSPAYSPNGASPFIDVTSGSSFSHEIRWLAAQGISTGWDARFGCRAYQPFGTVARDAMAAFMYRTTIGGTAPVQEGTCSPPPTPPGPSVGNPVTPGAYCARDIAGWFGFSADGILMQCRTSATDDRLRWRAA